jgi:hypothetical protein
MFCSVSPSAVVMLLSAWQIVLHPAGIMSPPLVMPLVSRTSERCISIKTGSLFLNFLRKLKKLRCTARFMSFYWTLVDLEFHAALSKLAPRFISGQDIYISSIFYLCPMAIARKSRSFAFSGCGWLLPCHLGVIQSMKQHGMLTEKSICAGTSGGAIAVRPGKPND